MASLDGTVRIRSLMWFATGVAVALAAALIVTQAWSAGATDNDDGTTFTPIEPCRLADTRPGFPPEGDKKTPVGPGFENRYSQQVTGIVGDCELPDGIDGVSLNVTIANPTEQSNLRLYPTDALEPPEVSNLNWLANQSPTPNKVDVKLGPDGAVYVQNFKGDVDVVLDVVGFYGKDSLVTDFEIVTRTLQISLQAGQFESFVAACPEGKRVTGGGVSLVDNSGLTIRRTIPDNSLSEWRGAVQALDGAGNAEVTVYAICAAGVYLVPS